MRPRAGSPLDGSGKETGLAQVLVGLRFLCCWAGSGIFYNHSEGGYTVGYTGGYTVASPPASSRRHHLQR